MSDVTRVQAEKLERGVKIKTPFHDVADETPFEDDEWDEVKSVEEKENGRLEVEMKSGIQLRCSKSSWVEAQL